MTNTTNTTGSSNRRPSWLTVAAIATATALAGAAVAASAAQSIDDADGPAQTEGPGVGESGPTPSTSQALSASDVGEVAPPVDVSTSAQATDDADRVTPSSQPDRQPQPQPQPGVGSLDGRWSTSGSMIVDGDGDEVQIRGVNWFGFETQNAVPHGLWQRDLDEMLDQIADLGFNTIRLPFAAEMLDSTAPVQGIDANSNPDLQGLTSLEVMDVFIERAGERGLAVILDRHALSFDDRHHLWFDDRFVHERLAQDWELLAERYGDDPNVIGADLYNEPHDEACWGCGDPEVDWKLAAQEAADALHAVDPDWLIFVEGVEEPDGASCDGPNASDACTWWGGNVMDAIDEPVELAVPNKVVYSPHEYATSVYRQAWFDDPSFPENMPAIWDRFWGDIEQRDIAPVMVGEFGTTLDSEIDGVWLESLLGYMDEHGIGFTFWTFNPNSGDTGGVLLDDWETVDEDKMAFLSPYLVGPFEPVG